MASVSNWCRPTIDTKGYSNVLLLHLSLSLYLSLSLSLPPPLSPHSLSLCLSLSLSFLFFSLSLLSLYFQCECLFNPISQSILSFTQIHPHTLYYLSPPCLYFKLSIFLSFSFCLFSFLSFSLTHHFFDPLFNKLFFIHFARCCCAKANLNGVSRCDKRLEQLVFVSTGFCWAFSRCGGPHSDALVSSVSIEKVYLIFTISLNFMKPFKPSMFSDLRWFS